MTAAADSADSAGAAERQSRPAAAPAVEGKRRPARERTG